MVGKDPVGRELEGGGGMMKTTSFLLALWILLTGVALATADLAALMTQAKRDTAERPPVDEYSGELNWTYQDIEGLEDRGGTVVVSTHWFPKPSMKRVAERMCKYLSAYGDIHHFGSVRVTGQGGQLLATCNKWP